MIDIGRICVKIAGRDAGKLCVVVEKLDQTFVMVDGETRRKKSNIRHLEPTNRTLDIKKGDHEEVKKLFESELKITITDSKPKESKERPRKQRKVKVEEKPTKKAKKTTKKAEVKKEK